MSRTRKVDPGSPAAREAKRRQNDEEIIKKREIKREIKRLNVYIKPPPAKAFTYSNLSTFSFPSFRIQNEAKRSPFLHTTTSPHAQTHNTHTHTHHHHHHLNVLAPYVVKSARFFHARRCRSWFLRPKLLRDKV